MGRSKDNKSYRMSERELQSYHSNRRAVYPDTFRNDHPSYQAERDYNEYSVRT